MIKGNRLTFYIIGAMLLGILVGYVVHTNTSPDFLVVFSKNIKILSTIFIRLVQMIIAPLVFTTLVVGIAKLGDLKTVGRVGGKAILWFVTASLASLLIGMLLVNFFEPGRFIDLSQRDTESLKDLANKQQGFSLQNFIEHIIPRSFVEAMATNEILQLVVFSIFFGVAAAAIGDYTKPLIKALEVASHVILKMVNYVMSFAPLGVFGAIAAVVAGKRTRAYLSFTLNIFCTSCWVLPHFGPCC
jgi:Na+/H+-dicarboxylate symporter